MARRPAMTLLSGLPRLAATSDPGLARLRMATRVTLTLALVVAALALTHGALALPPAATGIALVTAIQGSLAVREAEARAQVRTRFYAGLGGIGIVGVAILLEPHPRIADALFVVLVFAAVYGRKYGARWNAVGMFAFMSYSIAVYMHPAALDLPAVAVAIALSGVLSHLVRNHVLPEHPGEDFRRAVEALSRRIGDLCAAAAAGRRNGWPKDRRRDAVRRQTRLADAILAAEGYLPAEALSGDATRGPMGDLAVALFDLHLASESLLVAELAPPPPDEDEAAAAERREAAGTRLEAARRLVEDRARAAPIEAFTRSAQTPPALPPAPPGALVTDPQLRLAIQVAIAAAIALAGGLLISKTRFFWAILTAFLVFTNSQSRGDTALRAMNRALGTLVGIVAGIALAVLVAGNVPISVALAAVFVFAGFYLLQISYGAMTFFVTLTISLIYGLIGPFSADLLVLRLEETLMGAVAGVFVTFAVLPQSTRSAAETALDALLAALDDVLSAAAERVRSGGGRNLLALSRRLDHRYAALATAARPLGQRWQLVRRPGPIRRKLLAFMALAYWTRSLARALSGPPVEEDAKEATLAAIDAVRRHLAALRRRTGLLDATPNREPDLSPRGRKAGPSVGADDPLFALDVLSHILEALAAMPDAGGGPGAEPAAAPPDAVSTEAAPSAKGQRRIS